MGVVRKVGDSAERVVGLNQAASRVVHEGFVGCVGQATRTQAAQAVVAQVCDLAQRIGDACQVAPAVVGVAGGLARAVGVGLQQGAFVPAQLLDAAFGVCDAYWQATKVTHILGGGAVGCRFCQQVGLLVVRPAQLRAVR